MYVRKFLYITNCGLLVQRKAGGVSWWCHASNPGPTRLADPNRFPGRETQDWDFLPDFFFFFFKSQLAPMGYGPHPITESKELPPEWCSSKSIHI